MTEADYGPRPDGARILTLVGYGDLADQPIDYETKDGATHTLDRAADFPDVCGGETWKMFRRLEKMDPSNPENERFIVAAKTALSHYLKIDTES